MVFLKEDDWNKKASGSPDLPENLGQFLLRKPVRAEVTSFEGRRGTIDAGRRAGLRIGMTLTAQDLSVSKVRVTELQDDSAAVESVYGDKVSVHTRLSTLLYDRELQH